MNGDMFRCVPFAGSPRLRLLVRILTAPLLSLTFNLPIPVVSHLPSIVRLFGSSCVVNKGAHETRELMGMGMEESSTKDTAAVDEENNGSGESLSTSSATASPHQHLIDLLYLLSLPVRYNSQLRPGGVASVILNFLTDLCYPPAPNPISAHIIHGIPGCDIASVRPDVFTEPSRQDSGRKLGQGGGNMGSGVLRSCIGEFLRDRYSIRLHYGIALSIINCRGLIVRLQWLVTSTNIVSDIKPSQDAHIWLARGCRCLVGLCHIA